MDNHLDSAWHCYYCGCGTDRNSEVSKEYTWSDIKENPEAFSWPKPDYIDALLKRIEQLERQVTDLEYRLAAAGIEHYDGY